MKNSLIQYWMLSLVTLALGIQSSLAKPEQEAAKPAPLKAGYHEIKSKKAHDLLQKHKELIVLDIRTEREYVAGHIQKAKHIDYYERDFSDKLKKLDRKKPYLVHCASGGRSGKSMKIFKDLGFTRIYHMNDGFKGWEKSKFPVTKGKEKK